jgi:general secretion pathway protein D
VTGALSILPGVRFNGAFGRSNIVLRSLASDSRAMVLSAPSILMNDNAHGVLISVSEVPFASVNASKTVAMTGFAGFANVRTTIAVTPHFGEWDHPHGEYSGLEVPVHLV